MVIAVSKIEKDTESPPKQVEVPFFRPIIGRDEINEVVDCLTSGWLTAGPRVQRFERLFAEAVGASYAIALNSCTAALHLAVEALGLKAGEAVLVPAMTFAATAEIVRYLGAVPILVDCCPDSGNMDLVDAAHKLELVRNKQLLGNVPGAANVVGMIPVHVGGLMMDFEAVQRFAAERGLWIVEDAAHAFPGASRRTEADAWRRCGEGTASVSCFSFYANKTITTGEGGMAVTDDPDLADRIRLMSLHGLSNDAWKRYSGGGWDYRIMAPGFKYNLTDIAAAIGIHQLARAEEMRRDRENIGRFYRETFAELAELELPPEDRNRIHAWHLFPVRLRLDRLNINRNEFIEELKQRGVSTSVHWRPLHLHPYYQTFGWKPDDLPVATSMWQRLVSLPIFSGMTSAEMDHVVNTVRYLCAKHVC
jgi:dTDP-4-amino-4,6-dideoxygalactose transaminase